MCLSRVGLVVNVDRSRQSAGAGIELHLILCRRCSRYELEEVQYAAGEQEQ